MKLHRLLLLVASALLPIVLALAGCGKKDGEQGATKFPAAPMQGELVKLKTEGVLPAARRASALEFWLHYKLMLATGMAQDLGGEDKAIATLKAIATKFEQSAIVAQTSVPRAVKLGFDGNGLDAGVLGAGYGLVGTAITGGMLNGGLAPAEVEQLARHGPIKFDDKDGSAEVNVAQDGMDTAMEQTINENGVTGKVKTKVHLDACPDGSGKVTATIETESQMSADGKSGSVKAKFKYERWVDDDAHLISPTDNGYDEQAQVEMRGTGASGNNLSVNMTRGFARGDSAYTGTVDEHGHSFFRPEESQHTEKLLEGTVSTLRLIAEMMLNGGLTGNTPPWETGRCVDLKLRSDPARRTGAKPNTAYTLFAEPRAKSDGAPTRGTVKATLGGEHMLNPRDKKVPADAQFDYQNPEKKDQSATIDFEARSKRGVGKASLNFDTKNKGYRIGSAICPGGGRETRDVCDITKPFTVTFCGGQATITHTPASDKGGTWTMHFQGGGGTAESNGSYTLSGPETSLTETITSNRICAQAAGRTICTAPRSSSATWTQIDDCSAQ